MIWEFFLLWMFRVSVKRLHRLGFWMYIRRNSEWDSVEAYSLSKSGPPKPQVTVERVRFQETKEVQL